MSIEEKRELLLKAQREGKKVNCDGFVFGPYTVLYVGKEEVFVADGEGDESLIGIGCSWYIVEEPKKTAGYRRLIKIFSGEAVVRVCTNLVGHMSPKEWEEDSDFVRWIDTEWQYETVEE